MTTTVSFEIAKLLKEKGFKQAFGDGKKFYYPLTKELTENHRGDNYLAPTIAEVCMWLYEKHGIWIVSSYELNIENHKKEWFWMAIKDGEEIAYQYRDFNSPTEAYEAAIDYTLNNLI